MIHISQVIQYFNYFKDCALDLSYMNATFLIDNFERIERIT